MMSNRSNEFDFIWRKKPLQTYDQRLINLFKANTSWVGLFAAQSFDNLIAVEIIDYLKNGYPYKNTRVKIIDDARDLYLYLLYVKLSKKFEPNSEVARKLDYAIQEMGTIRICRSLYDQQDIKEVFSEQISYLAEKQQIERMNEFCDFIVDNNVEKIKLYLKNKEININSMFKGGAAIHWAVGHGRIEIVKILMEHGADLSLKNHRDETAIESATHSGLDAIVEILNAKAEVSNSLRH